MWKILYKTVKKIHLFKPTKNVDKKSAKISYFSRVFRDFHNINTPYYYHIYQ